MLIVEDQSRDKLVNPDLPLWRYMNFTKLASLLLSDNLFFPSIALLREDDSFEGSVPPRNFSHRDWNDISDVPKNDVLSEELKNSSSDEERKKNFNTARFVREIDIITHRSRIHTTAVSCWHRNDGESAAMWAIYTGLGEGIAITTSIERMKKAFSGTQQKIYPKLVRYEEFLPESSSSLTRSLNYKEHGAYIKRKSFEHEKELRLVVYEACGNTSAGSIMKQHLGYFSYPYQDFNHYNFREIEERIEKDLLNTENNTNSSKGASVNLTAVDLIENIKISPSSPDWLLDITRKFVSKFGISPILVSRSNILTAPLK